MYKLSTAGVFHTDADPNDNMNQGTEGEWPPFRKVCFSNLIYRKEHFHLYFKVNIKKCHDTGTYFKYYSGILSQIPSIS